MFSLLEDKYRNSPISLSSVIAKSSKLERLEMFYHMSELGKHFELQEYICLVKDQFTLLLFCNGSSGRMGQTLLSKCLVQVPRANLLDTPSSCG